MDFMDFARDPNVRDPSTVTPATTYHDPAGLFTPWKKIPRTPVRLFDYFNTMFTTRNERFSSPVPYNAPRPHTNKMPDGIIRVLISVSSVNSPCRVETDRFDWSFVSVTVRVTAVRPDETAASPRAEIWKTFDFAVGNTAVERCVWTSKRKKIIFPIDSHRKRSISIRRGAACRGPLLTCALVDNRVKRLTPRWTKFKTIIDRGKCWFYNIRFFFFLLFFF